jgi:hypothetical protein
MRLNLAKIQEEFPGIWAHEVLSQAPLQVLVHLGPRATLNIEQLCAWVRRVSGDSQATLHLCYCWKSLRVQYPLEA